METILLSILFLAIAFAGIAVKIIFKKDGEFAGTCATNNPYLKNEIGECTVCGRVPTESCTVENETSKA